MTLNDFIIEFDLLYNNALSGSAPNLNNYEKSLFLTQAQEELIRDLYEGKVDGLSYEQTERIRRRLKPITVHKISTYDSSLNTDLTNLKISNDSKFFVIESDVWYITLERLTTTGGKLLKVKPITQDDYSLSNENSFRKPNKRKAWRLDLDNTESTSEIVEIISTENLSSYTYRYLKEPTPVVLVDLVDDSDVGGLGLTIRNTTDPTLPVLPNEAHTVLLNKAIILATLAYKENTLQNNVQINN